MTNEEGGNDMIEQNHQYIQNSRTVYVESKHNLRIYYVHNKWITVLFFVRGSIKSTLRIIRDSELSVHPFHTIHPDNREYTVVWTSEISCWKVFDEYCM
jgi:hypothetical protein